MNADTFRKLVEAIAIADKNEMDKEDPVADFEAMVALVGRERAEVLAFYREMRKNGSRDVWADREKVAPNTAKKLRARGILTEDPFATAETVAEVAPVR